MLTNPNYVKALQTNPSPQLLQAYWCSHLYSCNILHASREFLGLGDRANFASHAHMLYHIVLFIKGENEVSYLDKPRICRPGTLIISGPGEMHNFFKRKPGEVTYLEVTFEYRRGEELLWLPFHEVLALLTGSSLPFIKYPVELDEGAWPQLATRMTALMEVMSAGLPHSVFSGHVILSDICGMLAWSVYTANKPEANGLAARLENVRRAIESNYGQALGIEDLASMAQISTGHFCREFKRAFGITPIGYLLQCRIAAARSLLLSTRMSCREIGMRVGFADEYYFSRVFKKMAGVSPVSYRRQSTACAQSTPISSLPK